MGKTVGAVEMLNFHVCMHRKWGKMASMDVVKADYVICRLLVGRFGRPCDG